MDHMPAFHPFAGVRYDTRRVSLDDVTAPPYDVIDEDLRGELEAKSPYNAVRVELSRDEPERDRYQAARESLRSWIDEGVLVEDASPCFYIVKMGFHDERGQPRQTTGVIGALELCPIGEGGVLPHERTMSKPKSDRLDLLRVCRMNLSPIWVLSLGDGLSGLCEQPAPPDDRCTDELGVHHRLWRVDSPAAVEAMAETVGSAPVVIADGHHRYETALAFQEEERSVHGPGPHDFVMAMAVELAEEQLSVRPIHRLFSGLPEGTDIVELLDAAFEVAETAPPDESLPDRMVDSGSLALVTKSRCWLLRPRAETAAASEGLDTIAVEVARQSFPPHEVVFQHGTDHAVAAVASGRAQAAVLLRPATVEHIAAAARARTRMPEKTTFFYPKPRTGLVFRRV